MSSLEHTPTPWAKEYIGTSPPPHELTDRPTVFYIGDYRIVVDKARGYDLHAEDEQDADFILAAVNAHDELVEALEIASNSCRDVTELGRFSPPVDPVRWVAQLKAHIDAALEKAGRSS